MVITTPKKIEKEWGNEEIIVNNDKYCAKRMTVFPGGKLSIQWHINKQETFHIEKGTLKVTIFLPTGNKFDYNLKPGESITIFPGQAHTFHNKTKQNVIFLEISTHHDNNDVYRVTKSCIDP